MSKVESFLTIQEEQEIISAIQIAEKNTSGEIRVHIEGSADKDIFKRSLEVFQRLKMFETKLQNSVLIYVAVNDKKFAVYGDKGIDKVVPKNFWNTTRNSMQAHFVKGNFKEAIVAGILKAGEELKTHFPWQIDDKNELFNEISKG